MSENDLNMVGLNTNLTNSNKWFCYLPIENILDEKDKGIELHVTRFSLPQMEQSSSEVSFRGYQKQIPTKVINFSTKELTLDFLVDENWNNYKCLYKWMSSGEGILNPVTKTTQSKIVPADYIPLRIYLLDNFKKKVVQFLFENCWIKLVSDIALESNNSSEITASFTFYYDRFIIENI